MSAKQAYAKPTRRLPDMPPEIWLEILRVATWLPEFSEAEYAHIDFLDAPYKEVYKDLWPVLVTKSALTRVCKQWNIWTTPFLYESIFVGRGRVLSSLCNALRGPTASANANSEEEPQLECGQPGRYTKRLDIALRCYSTSPINVVGGDEAGHDDWVQLTSIINMLPNLETVKFLISTTYRLQIPTKVMQAIATTCGPSLQVLDWHPPSPSPSLTDLSGLLRRTPNLRVLRAVPSLYTQHPYTEWDDLAETPITLSHLTELSAEWIHLGLDRRCRIPTPPPLNHLILKDNHWEDFLKVHGPSLTRLSLIPLHKRTIDWTIASFATNLRRLDIQVTDWLFFPRNLFIPPTCTHVGISSRANQAENYVYRRLAEVLRQLRGECWEMLIFLNDRDVRDLCQRHPKMVRPIMDSVAVRGVRTSNSHGQSLALLVPREYLY
ncbi:hypothetical protein BDN72DRAFT_188004 [Pluteus cervinus]|uniref:Uncharacterized protein n=1 Tax=Pluteus cervinus TaxID=181527 RepID=A0ACD3AJD0_9AGAR|nr:hypothetical protein BDN72DRAFT_188004 [Pluteus cervinus]